jgi:hypothetical protein
MSVATPVRRRQPVAVAATLICAASMLGLGLWAFLNAPSLGLLTVVALVAIYLHGRTP